MRFIYMQQQALFHSSRMFFKQFMEVNLGAERKICFVFQITERFQIFTTTSSVIE